MDNKLEFSPWKKLKINGKAPPNRYAHACAMIGSRMYSFGGASGSDENILYYNDFFVVDFEESPLCWKAVEQKGEIPSPREGTTLSAYNNDLYLYGGIDKEGTFTCAEGLYIFRTATSTWEKCTTRGNAPLAQSLSAVIIGNKLVTFGGVLDGKPRNDTAMLDLSTMEWRLLETTGTPPTPRCDHACCVVDEKMFVTAGSGGENVWFNDVYSLDLSTNTWTQLEVQGATPTPRDYATLCSVSQAYLVGFGGFSGCHGDDKCLAELSYIDLAPQKLRWCSAIVDTATSPSPRYGHSMIVHDKTVYIFAGQDTEGEYNDLWSISLNVPTLGYEPTPVPRPHYNTVTPIPAPRKTVKPVPPSEVKPRDFEELRSTYLQRINEMFDSLTEKFHQLDSAMAKLNAERTAFEEEKKAHTELYDKQQQELKEQLESHQAQNDKWLEEIRTENDAERLRLAEERAMLKKASADLAKEQELFQSKSEKLDAIMKQVQGLK